MTDDERLKTAQWVLERNLAWVAAAEVKVGVIVAIDTAMLGGLGAAFSAAQASTLGPWRWVAILLAVLGLGVAILAAAMAVLPRLEGPPLSLLFFGKIAGQPRPDFAQHFKSATCDEFLDDWLQQIHRNAEIACMKFSCVKKSMWLSFLSVAPWFIAIVLLLSVRGVPNGS